MLTNFFSIQFFHELLHIRTHIDKFQLFEGSNDMFRRESCFLLLCTTLICSCWDHSYKLCTWIMQSMLIGLDQSQGCHSTMIWSNQGWILGHLLYAKGCCRRLHCIRRYYISSESSFCWCSRGFWHGKEKGKERAFYLHNSQRQGLQGQKRFWALTQYVVWSASADVLHNRIAYQSWLET